MTDPRIIPVGQEPPPLYPAGSNGRHRGGDADKPKGKPSDAKAKARERFAVLNAFVDFSLAHLSRAEMAVWLILFRDSRDGTARTGITDLARRAGCDRSTVFRALRALERVGLLTAVHRGGLGKGLSVYRVCPLPKDG